MSRDLAFGSGIAGSVWALFEFGIVHSPELIGVVGPLLRLSERFGFLPTAPIKKAWVALMVLVLAVGVWKFAKDAQERFLG